MANPDHYYCDICGTKTKRRFFVATGRRMDAAGSMEDDGDSMDLCEPHLFEALSFLLNRPGTTRVPDHEAGKRLSAWFNGRKSK